MIGVLGGSWVVISRVISPLIWIVTLLITPLIATHEPPSRVPLKDCVQCLLLVLRVSGVSRPQLGHMGSSLSKDPCLGPQDSTAPLQKDPKTVPNVTLNPEP